MSNYTRKPEAKLKSVFPPAQLVTFVVDRKGSASGADRVVLQKVCGSMQGSQASRLFILHVQKMAS